MYFFFSMEQCCALANIVSAPALCEFFGSASGKVLVPRENDRRLFRALEILSQSVACKLQVQITVP